MTRPLTAQPISLDDVRFLRGLVDDVYVDDSIKRYVVDLINTTRFSGPRPVPGLERHVRVGASPRGGIALLRGGQARARLGGRASGLPAGILAGRSAGPGARPWRWPGALANNVPPEQLVDAVFDAVPTP